MNIGIATARISGLNTMPYEAEHLGWVWDIRFSKASTNFTNLAGIHVGKTEEEAMEYVTGLRQNFRELRIEEGSKVALLLKEDSGQIRAISSIGSNIWIDVRDYFIRKTFEEFHFEITNLIVH